MDSDLLHEIVFDVTGKDSLKKLSAWEAAAIIDGLVDDGAKIKKKRKPRRELPENVIELITGEQIRLIEYLLDRLGWDRPSQLTGFNKRVIKKERIGTKQEALKIIEGLKAMIERREKKEMNDTGRSKKKSHCRGSRPGKGSQG